MLETISLIASIISALTSVTTSLRALGKSREYSRLRHSEFHSMFLLYLAVTVIWFIISIIFVSPILYKGWVSSSYAGLYTGVLSFLFLFLVLWLIWKRILSLKNKK